MKSSIRVNLLLLAWELFFVSISAESAQSGTIHRSLFIGTAIIPTIVPGDKVFPGEGGCRDSTFNKCMNGGDGPSDTCIPTDDGSHKCNCSADYRLYSDGICKVYPDPCNTTTGLSGSDICQYFGDTPGACQINATFPSGYICLCPYGFYSAVTPFEGCYLDPCSFEPCNGGTCTAKNADGSTYGYPFTCSDCPVGTVFFDGTCTDPCSTSTCANGCTVSKTRATGFVCNCSSSEVFDGVSCVEPCGDPNIDGTKSCEQFGDSAARCFPTTASPTLYSCHCSPGFKSLYSTSTRLEGLQTCEDIDECTTLSSPCGTLDKLASCLNTIGSYTCTCSTGYRLYDGKCVAKQPCVAADKGNKNPCDDRLDWKAKCLPQTNGTYSCNCSTSFTFRDGTCRDINECLLLKDPCPATTCPTGKRMFCRNTHGSHRCSCGTTGQCVDGSSARCIKIDSKITHCACADGGYFYYN